MGNKMKTLSLVLLMIFGLSTFGFSQAKKPILMVVPSDVWCNQNGYMLEYDNQGVKVKVPDYKRALQENADLLLVISKINELMADRGFPLKNLESSLKSLENESAEEAMLSSKSGAGISESPIDKLKKVAKADIWLQVTWTVNQTGPKKSVTFNLQGLDAYSDKQVAGASGTGNPSFSAALPVLLEEAVLAHLDNFNTQLQSHFDDMFANGREVKVLVKMWDSATDDLETEYEVNGETLELLEAINHWMDDNCKNGRYSNTDATATMARYEQVRIPMTITDDKGRERAIDTRAFVSNLRKYLSGPPFNLTSKVYMRGLGEAWLIIGEK
ncbi:MAG TPA: DUF6175 family protein [Williamwhitmania sp.]|nr:DUF6175 family protein [Williamwhitmania sp.]